jgi:hypothetical protein
MKRSVVRFDREQLDAIGKLAARCAAETGKPARRAALVRLLVDVKLAEIDERQPLSAQLPLAELAIDRAPISRSSNEGGSTLRARILVTMAESPGEVFTPARLAPIVRAASRDTVRNTLLELAKQGRIEKLGPGQYRALLAICVPICAAARPVEARA